MGGLRQAAFWVGVRQEIYVAFANQRTILPALEHCNIDRSLNAAADHIWTGGMVVLCADILHYCFGDGDHTTTTYANVTDAVAAWFNSSPAAFTPVYTAPPGPKNLFPELWFVNDECVVGLQHYYLSRILLAAHNPQIPRLGRRRATALKAMDTEIKDHVRVLCGICVSNPAMAPN